MLHLDSHCGVWLPRINPEFLQGKSLERRMREKRKGLKSWSERHRVLYERPVSAPITASTRYPDSRNQGVSTVHSLVDGEGLE